MTMTTCAGGRPFPSPRVLLRLVVAGVALAIGVAAVPASKPEDIGLSSERLQRIGQLIERYIADKQITGAVTVVTRKSRVAHFEAIGQDAESRVPMRKDGIFRMASMSKPVTGVAILTLAAQRGRVAPPRVEVSAT